MRWFPALDRIRDRLGTALRAMKPTGPISVKTWLLRSLAASFILLALGIAYLVREYPDEVWSAKTVDFAVISVVVIFPIVAAVALFSVSRPDSIWLRAIRRNVLGWGGAGLAILTVYVAYASFRNQSMLASESGLNDAGYQLYEIEMQSSELRCLYFNYGHVGPEQCLQDMVANPATWSRGMLYVEESWFQLAKANTERHKWGGTYAEEIKYWAEDVGRDPTGVFSYYLVSTENSLSKAQETMEKAGVTIVDPCINFMRVWTALRERRAEPTHISGAARACGATGAHLQISEDE